MLRQELEGPWSDIDPDEAWYVCILCGTRFYFGGDPAEVPYHEEGEVEGFLCDPCAGVEPPDPDPEPPSDAEMQFLLGDGPEPPTIKCDCCDVQQPGSAFTLGGAGYAVPGTAMCNECAGRFQKSGTPPEERPACPVCWTSLEEYGFCYPCRGYYAPLPPAV